jgi:hypothetical protein
MNISSRRISVVATLAAVALVAPSVGCNRETRADLKSSPEVVAKMREIDASAASGGPKAEIKGWGTLKGRFTYNGAPPAGKVNAGFAPEKDPLCKLKVPDETLVVDGSSKGIANIVIFLTEAPGVHPDIVAAPPKEVVFDQKECRFLEHVAAVSMKDKWVILNGDETSHNASGAPGRGNPSFNPLLAPRTGRYEYPGFKNPLTVPFEISCAIHPWMKSYVIARPDPYFAITGKDGSFTIDNLPAGLELEFQVWHERAPTGLKAKPEWNRGRVKLTIPGDGEVVNLNDIAVDPALLP